MMVESTSGASSMVLLTFTLDYIQEAAINERCAQETSNGEPLDNFEPSTWTEVLNSYKSRLNTFDVPWLFGCWA